MEKNLQSALGARLFVVVALAVAAWALVHKTGVASSDEAGIVLLLPEQVGDWHGVDLLFCANRDCGAQYFASQLADSATCPPARFRLGQHELGRALHVARRHRSDAQVLRRPGDRDEIQATIVLSGDDRSSIHRPQVCMTAAGHEIARERIISIPLAGRRGAAGSRRAGHGAFLCERRRHARRLFVVLRLLVRRQKPRNGFPSRPHGVDGLRSRFPWHFHRWAYIALSGARTPGSDEHLQTIADFASQLHPALLKPE
jgi:hypothetical protein